MRLLFLLPILIAVYGTFHFVLRELLKRKKGGDALRKVALAGVTSGIKIVRDAALNAAVVYLILAVLLYLYGHLFGANANVLLRFVQVGQVTASVLKRSGSVIQSATFILLTAGLVSLCLVHHRRYFISFFRRRYDQDILRAHSDGKRKTEFSESDEARRIRAKIQEAQAAFDRLSDSKEPVNWRARQDWLSNIKNLNNQLAAEEQRCRLAADKTTVGQQPNRWWRIAQFFVSKGLYADLKLSSKIISSLTAAAVALGLVSISGPALADSVWQRMLRFDDLRVAAVKADVNKQIEMTKGPQPTALTADDVKAVRYFNSQFVRALVNNGYWNSTISPETPNAALRRETTARAIVDRAQVPGNDPIVANAKPLSESDATIVQEVSAGKESGLTGKVGSESDAEVVSWFGEQWGKVRANLLAHAEKYGQPVEFSDVRGAMIDKIVGVAFDQAPGSDNVLSKTAHDVLKSVAKNSIKEAVEIEFREAAIDLKQGSSLDDVLVHVRIKVLNVPLRQTERIALFGRIIDEHGLLARLQRAGFGLRMRPEAGVDPQQANAVADEIANAAASNSKEPVPSEVVDALDDYDHHFPASESRPPDSEPPPTAPSTSAPKPPFKGGPSSFSSTEVVQRVNTQLGRVLNQALEAPPQFQVARAHSFEMLTGYSRVGGVLIGREPKSLSIGNFQDLRWDVSGRQITLNFVRDDKTEFTFGPYDKTLVHQALIYAADGRPLAVTMTNARPLPELKILVHPALLDTPLGAQIINLDRWVDTYARGNQDVKGPTAQVYNQVYLYRIAWTERFKALISKMRSTRGVSRDDIAQLDRIGRAVEEGTAELKNELGSELLSKFPTSEEISDKRESLLAVKYQFYDPNLVEWVADCVTTATLEKFEKCIDEKAETGMSGRLSDYADRWAVRPPSFMPWSGVREIGYDSCKDLSCIGKPTAADETELWPFDFMLQAAFTSPPFFLSEPEDKGTPSNQYVDAQPFEFPQVHKQISEHIREAIRKDQKLQKELAGIRDFTILQRLFRIALSGRLGPDFPLEKLVSLTTVAAEDISACRTPRWNAASLELEFSGMLSDFQNGVDHMRKTEPQFQPSEVLEKLMGRIRICQDVISAKAGINMSLMSWLDALGKDSSLTDAQKSDSIGSLEKSLANISDQNWKNACGYGDLASRLEVECRDQGDVVRCRAWDIAAGSDEMARARRLSKALGVDLDLNRSDSCQASAGFTAQPGR